MDAIYYGNPLTQYSTENMSRELIKAYTSFRIPTPFQHLRYGIATGNWGCGAFNGDRQLKGMN
jgi:poly(ADP-ribose) glycohydrolase